jgi:predicted Zn-dependent peptidase
MLATMDAGTDKRDIRAQRVFLAEHSILGPDWRFTHDYAVEWVRMRPDDFAEAAEALVGIVFHPTLDKTYVERFREQAARGVAARRVEFDGLAEATLRASLFGSHPYGSVLTAAGLRAVRREDVVALHARVFDPSRLAFVVSCPLEPVDVVAKLQAAVGASAAHAPAPPVHLPPVPAASASAVRIVVLDRPGVSVASLAVGVAAPPLSAADAPATRVAHEILVDPLQGRQKKRLRDELALVSRFTSIDWEGSAAAVLGWTASVSSENVAAVLAQMDRVTRELAATAPSEDDLAGSRSRAAFGLMKSYSTAEDLTTALTTSIGLGQAPDAFSQAPARLSSLTLDEVRAAAAKHFSPEAMRYVVVGDFAKLRASLSELGWGPIEVREEPDVGPRSPPASGPRN